MKYTSKLSEGTLLKRYKRFFTDISFEGKTITAHLPNTGSLKTVPLSDTPCRFSTSDDPKRKLPYTLEMIKAEKDWAGVNTRTPNIVVKEALAEGLNKKFKEFQSEVKISEKTRIDFVLYKGEPTKLKFPQFFDEYKPSQLHFIEVKNVTMKKDSTAYFPDGITARGTKHLIELMELSEKGYSTEILFTIQRQGCHSFDVAEDIDPKYAETLRKAKKAGVKISAYEVSLTKSKASLDVTKKIKILI